MTKGTFFLNESLRRGAPMVTDVGPGCFMARSRLPFPQGLQFFYKVFQGRPLADVYSHGYFIEKQANPEQPSPQFHLTEELQGLMRVVKGLIYMNDVSSRLDNAMTVVRDPNFPEGSERESWIMYNPIELDEKTLPALRQRLTGSNAYLNPRVGVDEEINSIGAMKRTEELRAKIKDKISTIIVPSQQTYGKIGFWMEEFPSARIIASGPSIPPRVAEELFAGKTEEQKAAMLKRFTFIAPAPVITPVPTAGSAAAAAAAAASGSDGAGASSHQNFGLPTDAHESLSPAPPVLNIAPEALLDQSSLTIGDGVSLRRVPGDALTNELVLLHGLSRSLACTDLFHGAYADFDPLNTWMCRAWFKFNRNGDYKDARILPLFRRRQIEAQNGGSVEKGGQGLGPMQQFVAELVEKDKEWMGTRQGVDIICHSHGTPPTRADAMDLLMAQYDLKTVPRQELASFDVSRTNMFGGDQV